MKAICIHATGDADVLRFEDVADPVLRAADDVVVAIHAASVNAADYKVRRGGTGLRFPHVLGRDFSGVVLAAGDKADLRPGDEVFGVCMSNVEGAYAQRIVIAAGMLARKPAEVSHVQAAAIGLAGLTALVSLEDTLKLVRGEKILVQGGAGGVGSMAVQLACHLGAQVAATARSVNHGYLRSLGDAQPIDYTQQDPASVLGDCQAALDTVGGATVAQTFASLASGGRAAFITGATAPPAPRADVVSLRPAVHRSRALMERVAAYAQSGVFRVPEILELPLAETQRAHALSEQGHVRGKIVLLP